MVDSTHRCFSLKIDIDYACCGIEHIFPFVGDDNVHCLFV